METDILIKSLDNGKVVLFELSCRALSPENPRLSSIQCTYKRGERTPLEINFEPTIITIAKPNRRIYLDIEDENLWSSEISSSL